MKGGVWTMVVAGALALTACSGRHTDVPPTMWTVAQAASIDSIRGTPVRVRHCEGLGEGQKAGSRIFYSRFRCLAGTRLPHEAFDTVAVTYVLRPLGRFSGGSSRYELTDVRFAALAVP